MGQPLANSQSDVSVPSTGAASERWFADEVYPHGSALKAHLRTSFPTVRDFEDVVQESYVRVWRRQALRPIESVKGFLFQVARRLAIDSLRRDRRRTGAADEDALAAVVADERPTPAAAVSTGEMHDLLAEAFLTLPNRCREILVLRRIKGLSQREVADQLSLSERTVENQCRIGIEKCEKYLRARGVNQLYHDGH